MRAEAVQAMQFQLQRKGRAQDEPAQCSFAHVRRVLELHVLAHAIGNLFRLFARKSQALQNLSRHFRADFFVAVKVDLPRGRVRLGRLRFGDVVQQHGPGQRWIRMLRQMREHQANVVVQRSFRMKIGRLRAINRPGNFRQDFGQQATLAQQLKPT